MVFNREVLEEKQIWIYAITLLIAAVVGMAWENSASLSIFIEPAIGILLFSMFCQIPFLALRKVFENSAFFKALLVGNFVIIPVLVELLSVFFITDSMITLGVFLVLLTPCIDYVIVFSHLGKGDSQSMLAATPLLFILQLLLLPIYLLFFVGRESLSVFEISPFVKTFCNLIVLPFILALLTQLFSKKAVLGKALLAFSGWLPIPFMALVLFVVLASQTTILAANPSPILTVLPLYLLYHVIAPFAGLASSRLFNLNTLGTRTVSFSTSTRNSLVVLPLALALPTPGNQIVAAVIVTQTIVELVSELIYIKVIPLIIHEKY